VTTHETTVADVIRVLEHAYPPATAEPWDAVGLAVGSRRAPVHAIAYAVDCTTTVVAEAATAGADLIVAHHPPFLRGLPAVDLAHPKGRLVGDLLSAGISVYVAHTNADIPPTGVAAALAEALGLQQPRPLRTAAPPAVDKLVTFVPAEHLDAVVDALDAAGAGRIGPYRRCTFRSVGLGTFTPQPGATPYRGQVGSEEQVPETRLEMVLPRSRRDGVVAALLAAHPYEVPAFDVLELAALPSPDTGLGRVGALADPLPLGEFADRVLAALPATPRGLLLAGDADRPVQRVAVQAGAGDDLLEEARQAGADAYVTSDLRHHPAGEAQAWDAAPALIDIPHWAAEWTWLPVVQRLVADQVELPSYVSRICTDPWTGRRG
jgi:dinuclear metal center YbgI/SA1388 family protein